MTSRRYIGVLVVMLLALIGALTTAGSAQAVTANVTITASTASNGTTTLTYRSTVTRAGTVRDVVMSIPPGSAGSVTSVNGTVRTVSPGVLRWVPSRTVTVGVGARFSIPLYGLRLPTGGPWTLSFKATGTTGAVLSSGTGALGGGTPASSGVTITSSSLVPGQKTTLKYSGKVTRSGSLTAIRMQLPPGLRGAITSVNGTLTTSGGYATWRPRSVISVGVGTALSIPIYGGTLSRFGGSHTLTMTASTSTGTLLMSGAGGLTLIAPPAAMPAVPIADFAPVPDGCPTAWPTVAEENAKPGNAEWVIPAASYAGSVTAAYLTQVSATCGTTVDIKVSSGKPVSIVAYRMGYYAGLGAREVWRADDIPTVVQPPATIGGYDSAGNALNMVSADNWSTTLSIPVDQAWVPGTYLVRVDDGTYAAYAPLTIRDDTGTKHDILIQQATTTWQAYNRWGGRSFYSPSLSLGSGRLSFDRPYDEGQGSGQYLPLEQGLVMWAEGKGLDVTYWTDNDLDELGGQLPARASTIFLPAHDEYYSLPMRAALSQAIDRGVNVGSLGANQVYRLLTFTSGDRREWDIDRYTAGYSSTTWRWLGDAYASQPLLGAEYVCRVPGDTLTTGASWLFDGIPAGTSIPGFVAGEIDTVDTNLYRPAGLATIATGFAACAGSTVPRPMTATAFTAPSGARVVNASVWSIGCFLGGRCPSTWTVPDPSTASTQKVGVMMANITEWVTNGTVVVPDASTASALKVEVPIQTLHTHSER